MLVALAHAEEETMLVRIKFHGEPEGVAVTEEEREQVLRAMYDMDDPKVAAVLEDYLGGDSEAAAFLGVSEEDLDPDDPDEVPDDLWGRWLIEQLDRNGRWIEKEGERMVRIRMERTPGPDGAWPGGPVEVCPLHGDREQAWRKVTSWGDLRRALDIAREEEEEALAQLAAEKRAERARFDDLRNAHQAVQDAERALAAARRQRRDIARSHIQAGDTMYRVAKEVRLSPQAVAKWID